MKKFLHVAALAICTLIATVNANAQVITADRAQEIANSFFSSGMQKSAAVRSTAAASLKKSADSRILSNGSSNEAPTFHILTPASGEGFVIVSGEEIENPIIGYSLDGTIDTNNLPVGFVDYITDIDAQVKALRKQNAENPQKAAAARSAMQKTNYNATTMGDKVYLETASWGQDYPFNTQCFTSYNGSTNALTGCVPTAYAIIMRYHEWPQVGTGTLYNCQAPTYVEITDRTYDYSKMPLVYDGNWSTEQINEVAKLMSHLGHAFMVTYGSSQTSVSDPNSTDKPNKYFNYNLVNASYQANFTMDSWEEKIKESINNGCPIPYASYNAATGDTRHMFVLDGYTANDYFHFNFGWMGNGNGWFKLDAITPSTGDDYSWKDGAEHYAIFNFTPKKTLHTVTASVSPAGAGAVTVNGSENSAEVIEGTAATLTATANDGYTFSHWSKGDEQVSTEKSYKAKVASSDNDYVANFLTVGTSRVNITVSYDSSKGTVTYNDNAVSGTGITPYQNSEVTLTATPLDGYIFTGWTVTKGTESTNYSGTLLTLVATEDMSVQASFSLAETDYIIDNTTGTTLTTSRVNYWEHNSVDLTLSSSEEAIAYSNENVALNAGSGTVTFTLTAPAGYTITKYVFSQCLSSNNLSIVADREYPLTSSEQDITISNVNAASAQFTVKGDAYKSIYTKKIIVTLRKDGIGSGTTTTQYTITASASPATAGSVTGGGTYTEGATVTLTATPNSGYEFVNWANGTNTVSTSATYSFTATANAEYVANFQTVTPATYTVTTTANPAEGGTATFAEGTGQATTSATVASGTEITLYAEANDGYNFVNWTKNGVQVSTDATCNVTITEASNYVANFEEEAQEPAQNNNIKVAGVKQVPETRFNISQGMKTGYYLLKQVNNATDANGGNGVGWIKADSEAAGQPENDGATTEYDANSRKKVSTTNASPDVLCVWYVEVVNAENKEIKISTANKIGSWYLPTGSQRAKGLTSYENATVLKYHTSSVTLGGRTAKANEGACLISNSDENSFIHFSGSELGSWSDANPGSIFMVEFYELSIDDLKQIFTVAVTASEGGTATASAATVVEGDNVTLTATADNNHSFVGWFDGETKVSEENPYTFAAASNINYVANFEEKFPDGAYKIYWQADNRGYLAYHATDYPNEAKLAGVTYSGCQNIHYAVDQVDLVWYLITADDGKRYLFQAATGKFLGVDTSIQANGTGNKLSTTEAWPIAIEENTKHTGHYIITTEINGTNSLLCSGCGTPKEEHPVRWLTVNDINQTDGGAPLQLIPVNDVTVADNVMNAVLAVINGTDEPEQQTLNVTFNNATYTKTDGTELTSGWGYQVVTQTTPAVTIKVAETINNFGYTTGVISGVKTPYLYKNTNFILSISEQYKITGYKITVRGQDNSYSGDFTCSVDGNETSKATLSGTTTQTLSATGLDTNIINISVGGTSGNGIFITALEITYVENEFEPLPFKAEVEGWRDNNPNTHLGTITIGGTAMKLTPAHQTASELTMPVVEGTTLAFTRKYRGFEFRGFYIGATELGTNPTLTAENVAAINETTPLVAKFTATDDVTLFYDDDEFSYRIPAIAKTGTNRLIAVSDYRHSHDDIGRDNHNTGTLRVDLVMRTSDDNGLTWSAKQTIAEGNQNFGYGDAAVVANGENILVMAVAGNVFFANANANNKQRTYRIYSSDNGATWNKEEVSNNLYTLFPNGYGMFFGSGKLVVDPNFNNSGNARVYGAVLLNDGNNYVVYSDDWGSTWNILGGGAAASANEPKVEILPNGQILLSARRGGGRTFNVFTYTDKANNSGTWSTATNGCDNGGNGTNGEIICLDAKKPNGKPTKILLQSQPYGSDRRNVSIWYKEIDANETYTASSIASDWTMGKQVSTQLSAYSAMCLQANGEIALFFEEAPCHNDDHTYGYSMVYVPLTIEEITNDNFLNPNADVETVTVDVTLTDKDGNTYNHLFDYLPGDAAAIDAALKTAYPFITELGVGNLQGSDTYYTYTNTVTLPFRVSNNDITVWHNIYWPANGTSAGEFYPIYMVATAENATCVAKHTEKLHYGDSKYNTLAYAEELGWAVYSVNNTLTFKFKNRLTGKFMAVNGVVSSGNDDNVIFTDEASATVFTLEKKSASANTAWGNYGIKSVYDGTTGYICNTSAGFDYATNYTGNNHPGAWAEFVEAAEESIIYDLRFVQEFFGEGEGKRVITDEIQAIITALESPENIILNTLEQYADILDNAMATWPELTLVVNENAGSVTINNEAVKSKKAPSGYEFTIVATPASGYRFTQWSNGTTTVSTDASYTFNMPDASTELTANFEKEGLTTGYYHLVSRVTTSHEYLYNNALKTNNSKKYTLQSDSKITTNNGIWYITVNNKQLGIKNGDGNALITGAAYCGDATSYNTLNIEKTTTVDDIIYYSFTEGINCTNRTQYNFTLEGGTSVSATDNNYVTTWAEYPDDQANQWRLEPVDTEGKNIYDVIVECTEQDVYVVYGSGTGEEYAFNGGFFITEATITPELLTAKKNNAAAEGVTVLVEGNTIKVVDTEYIDITVSTTPAESGSVTINGETASTLQVVKSSNVTVVATPANGYHFVNWIDAGGNIVSTDATYTFTAGESTSLVANFEADVVYHTITVSTYYNNNGGTVTVGEEGTTSANVAEGNSVRMLATAADGYEFMGWLKDGVLVRNAIDNSLELEIQGPDYTLYDITASAEYVAIFSKITDKTNLEDGKAYRICGVEENGRARCIYRDGNTLKWKYDYDDNDVNTIFVVQKNGNAINLISAVGYHGWKASYMLGNDEQYNPYAAIKVTYGTRDELRTLYIESGTASGLFQTNKDNAFSFQNSRGGSLTIVAQGEITTDFLFVEATGYAFQVSAADGSNAKLGTINLPFATTVPEGVTAYGVEYTEGENVHMTPLSLTNNVLPANTPVLVEAGTAGKFGFAPAPASDDVFETGFAGTLEAEEIPGTTNAYILSYKGAGTHIMLYKLSSTARKINANKAYYIDATGKASALKFVFGGTTDIEEVKGENGEVEAIYDLQGRKLSEITEPGMYIINGKKVYKK